jgi:hypothetical protein
LVPGLPGHSGVAYYSEQIQFLDLSARKAASFTTSFTIDMDLVIINGSATYGDGMAFVLSDSKSQIGTCGGSLDIYDDSGRTSSNYVVVEFDSHVSFNLHSVNFVAAANLSNVNVSFQQAGLRYAWVEYRTI